MREHLSKRDNWQKYSGARGEAPEKIFFAIFEGYFDNKDYEVVLKPKNLKAIYAEHHGIEPDHAIKNKITGRMIFTEIKRQRASGNAHERVCKYFSPGIIKAGREVGNIRQDDYPFWLIFCDGIAKEPRYRREIEFWFGDLTHSLTFWKNLSDRDPLLKHFENHIAARLN